VRAAFHQPQCRSYRVLSVLSGLLIVFSVLLFIEPIMAWGVLPESWGPLFDLPITLAFSLELLARVITYPPPAQHTFLWSRPALLRLHLMERLKFLANPLNLIDLLAILAFVPELRGLRVLRVLRFLNNRLFFRHSQAFQRIFRGFHENRVPILFAFTILGLEVLLGGLALFLFESRANDNVNTLADGFWWALVTLTTVGFGDITPATTLGRGIGALLMLGGLVTLALFAGLIGQTFIQVIMTLREEQYRMGQHVHHIVVCGYQTGFDEFLTDMQKERMPDSPIVILAETERDPNVPPEFHWVCGDPTKESEFDKVRLTHAHGVVILAPRKLPPSQADAITLMIAFTVRAYLAKRNTLQRRRPLHVVAEILDPENVEHAKTAGIDEIIASSQIAYSLIAHAIAVPDSGRIMSTVALAEDINLYVGRRPAGDHAANFQELALLLKQQLNVLLIGFRNADSSLSLNPPALEAVPPDAALIYLAERPILPLL
jgi:voltage-gated potassium channel Kch